jgi:hypothetical protein
MVLDRSSQTQTAVATPPRPTPLYKVYIFFLIHTTKGWYQYSSGEYIGNLIILDGSSQIMELVVPAKQ